MRAHGGRIADPWGENTHGTGNMRIHMRGPFSVYMEGGRETRCCLIHLHFFTSQNLSTFPSNTSFTCAHHQALKIGDTVVCLIDSRPFLFPPPHQPPETCRPSPSITHHSIILDRIAAQKKMRKSNEQSLAFSMAKISQLQEVVGANIMQSFAVCTDSHTEHVVRADIGNNKIETYPSRGGEALPSPKRHADALEEDPNRQARYD